MLDTSVHAVEVLVAGRLLLSAWDATELMRDTVDPTTSFSCLSSMIDHRVFHLGSQV